MNLDIWLDEMGILLGALGGIFDLDKAIKFDDDR